MNRGANALGDFGGFDLADRINGAGPRSLGTATVPFDPWRDVDVGFASDNDAEAKPCMFPQQSTFSLSLILVGYGVVNRAQTLRL